MMCPAAYLPDSFRPTATPLMRLGSDHDGGYVVARHAVERSTHLLSFGLEANWKFEADYLELKRNHADCTGIDAYDPTVTSWLLLKRTVRHVGRMLRRKRLGHSETWSSYRRLFRSTCVTHHLKWIGRASSLNTVDFKTCLADVPSAARVFLKMDIEGSEYEILDQIVESSHRLSGIAMELHSFNNAHRDHADLFDELHRRFQVAHVHVNNSGPLDPSGCPTTVELSYINNRLVQAVPEGPCWRAGSELDQPNCRHLPDYQIQFRAA